MVGNGRTGRIQVSAGPRRTWLANALTVIDLLTHPAGTASIRVSTVASTRRSGSGAPVNV